MRLDIYLKEKFGFSREYAKEIIKSGNLLINGKPCTLKPSADVNDDFEITLLPDALPKYVSRGGYKLEKALTEFNIDLQNKICIDVGASTGGFTDCMLQNGAKKVYAVDVGTAQLADKLRSNPNVVSMENTNINQADIPERADFISVDVSFVSLSLVMQKVYSLLKDNSTAVMLIKPQFEAGRANIGKKGIVKNKKVHKNVIKKVFIDANNCGFSVWGITKSPIKGGDGNIEYLMLVKRCAAVQNAVIDIDSLLTAFES